jgi:predicted metal-dependent hydrolase
MLALGISHSVCFKRETAMNPTRTKPPISSTSPEIVVRQLLVNMQDGFPRHWNAGDAFLTQYYNAFSMVFPEGEQGFIDTVRLCLPLLDTAPTNDALRQAVKDFIAQEAIHKQVHERFNAVLIQQGLRNHWQDWMHDRLKKASGKLATKKTHPLELLATTLAYEHITAVFADLHLQRTDLLAHATPSIQALWRWHIAEESEHRSVVFDLYQACGGTYQCRLIAGIKTVTWFFWAASRQTVSNLWHDKTLFKFSTLFSATRFMLHHKRGLFWAFIGPYLSYVCRDFHPWNGSSQVPAADWLNSNQSIWRALKPAQ